MRRYLLDTTIVSAYLYNRQVALDLVTPWLRGGEAATSILVYGEVIEHLKGRPDFSVHRAQLRGLLQEVQPYFLTYHILERYADIRRELRRQGPGLIGDVDTLIAATALERNLTVITSDADFQRVPRLQVMLIPRGSLELR